MYIHVYMCTYMCTCMYNNGIQMYSETLTRWDQPFCWFVLCGRLSSLTLVIVFSRLPLQHSSSIIRDTFEEYQDDQEDTGVTGFLTVAVDLKKTDARPENQSELKKSLELLPSSKETKKVEMRDNGKKEEWEKKGREDNMRRER